MDGYTGRLYEEEFFGVCAGRARGYMTWRESMAFAKEFQPKGWNPSEPNTKMANNLHARVCMAIEERICEDLDWEKVKLFSAIGTPLDWYHGIDAWFEFEGTVVTIDLTVDQNKQSSKANLVIHPGEDELPNLIRHIAMRLLGAA